MEKKRASLPPAFLAAYYLTVIVNVFRVKGAVCLQYLCVHNWLLLFALNVALAASGERLLESRAAQFAVATTYGSCFTMCFIVMKYWDDAFTNLEHLAAHYLPLVFTFLQARKCRCSLFDVAFFQFAMFLLVRNPDELYELEFRERYLDLLTTTLGGYVSLRYCDMAFKMLAGALGRLV